MIAAIFAMTMWASPAPPEGWQDLRWGMTQEAAMAAAGPGFERVPQEQQQARRSGTVALVGPAEAGPFNFQAALAFYNGQLSGVSLQPPLDQCGNLEYWLIDLYGEPEGHRPGELYVWRFPEVNTRVEFNDGRRSGIGGQCALRYNALRHAGNAGL